MLKSITLSICIIFLGLGFGQAKAIDLGKGETLACEAILCAVGIAIPESHSECKKVLTEWSLYLATLGPFSSKPKCPSADAGGNITGWQEMKCETIQDTEMRQKCLDALGGGTGDQCDSITDPVERIECECRNNDGGGINTGDTPPQDCL